MEALRACYADLLRLAPPEAEALRLAAAAAEGRLDLPLAELPALSGTLELPGVALAGAPVLLKFVLPRCCSGGAASSAAAAPSLTVLCNAPRHAADSLQRTASATADEAAADNAPCLLLAADRLTAAAEELAAGEAAARQCASVQAAAGEAQKPAAPAGREPCLSRRCIWFHHLVSLTKAGGGGCGIESASFLNGGTPPHPAELTTCCRPLRLPRSASSLSSGGGSWAWADTASLASQACCS